MCTLKSRPETQTGNLKFAQLFADTREGGTPNFWFPKLNSASGKPLLQSPELSAQQQKGGKAEPGSRLALCWASQGKRSALLLGPNPGPRTKMMLRRPAQPNRVRLSQKPPQKAKQYLFPGWCGEAILQMF